MIFRKKSDMNEDFPFLGNNEFWCVIIDQIFSTALVEQGPNFQLTIAQYYACKG